jgi:hypothetical protein
MAFGFGVTSTPFHSHDLAHLVRCCLFSLTHSDSTTQEDRDFKVTVHTTPELQAFTASPRNHTNTHHTCSFRETEEGGGKKRGSEVATTQDVA